MTIAASNTSIENEDTPSQIPLRFDIISLFPDFFTSPLQSGLLGKALARRIAEVFITNPRDFTTDKHHKVDDEPYGGGVGMLMKPEPIFAAVEALPILSRREIILMTPQGEPMRQSLFQELAIDYTQLAVICGHYEGVDERVRHLVTREVSLGDFVLTCGEIPALALLNGVIRLLPGVVGKPDSLKYESFEAGLLDYPQYTRPAQFRQWSTPEVLRSRQPRRNQTLAARAANPAHQIQTPGLVCAVARGAGGGWVDEWILDFGFSCSSSFLRRPYLPHLPLPPHPLHPFYPHSPIPSIPSTLMTLRIGNGYDIHRLGPNRPLILGGVHIPHALGLLGHSDADVLTHAIMDALLGALSLGDIGLYFPPSDPQWEGADSLVLLNQVHQMIRIRGWRICNLDTVIVAERPKLKPHIQAMRGRLADVLKVQPDQIGVKATTNEKLGPTGREEGIAAYAVALLDKS